MNKQRKKVDNTMKQLASKMVYSEIDKWPPDCCGFIYQPKRPEFRPKAAEKKVKQEA